MDFDLNETFSISLIMMAKRSDHEKNPSPLEKGFLWDVLSTMGGDFYYFYDKSRFLLCQ
jgi:hypothetical protein